jgi:putative hydrolase of the HAD superfamily
LLKRTLIFDADDTLWESNVYFIGATEAFLDVMEEHRLERAAAREHLTEVERTLIEQYGYGTTVFVQALTSAARSLIPEIAAEALTHVEGLGQAIINRSEMTILPGVETALKHLADHDRLILLTKGDDWEQRNKLRLSGLERFFEHVAVVREKDVDAYTALIGELNLDPAYTWMIGNSPRSDINPALASGLNAVLIPHPQTWEMELEELMDPSSDRLTVVESVSELMTLFAGIEGTSGDPLSTTDQS